MRHTRFFVLVLIVSSIPFQMFSQSPDLKEIHDRALETESRLQVLSLSLKPGFEDFSVLAYLKHFRGAKVTSVYFTNGENSESDVQAEYPNERAATLRREAFEAMNVLGAEAYYLNFPDFGFSEDSALIADYWPPDKVRESLSAMIDRFRPDLILVPRDAEATGKSTRWGVMMEHLPLAARRKPKRSSSWNEWEVARLIADDGMGSGEGFPPDGRHPVDGASPVEEAMKAMQSYVSLSKHSFLTGRQTRSYRVVVPVGDQKKNLDSGLPPSLPSDLRMLDAAVQKACGDIRRHCAKGTLTSGRRSVFLRTVAGLIDSVGIRISSLANLGIKERKVLLGWKEALEELRNALLGAKLYYSVSDRMLVNRQLTYIRVDSLIGESRGGSTMVYFPAVSQDGWILDEKWISPVPLRTGDPYRLVSPESVIFSLPSAVNGISTNEYGSPLWFLVVHQSPEPEKNFVIRVRERILFAPKLTIEVLTPIVRASAGDRLRVRLTNYSRDSFGDILSIQDSLVQSPGHRVRLSQKDLFVVIGVELNWEKGIKPGNYLVPFKLGETEVGFFLARSFPAIVDSTKTVGFVSSMEDGVLEQSLRRLGIVPRRIADVNQSKGLDVLFVDHRAATLLSEDVLTEPGLAAVAESGTHVVILSQDADVWINRPLMKDIVLEETESLDVRRAMRLDSTHALATAPNAISPEVWNDWLNERARHTVKVSGGEATETPLTGGGNNSPLLATRRVGQGRMTYIALALEKQLLNIHEGSFQLLANLISY